MITIDTSGFDEAVKELAGFSTRLKKQQRKVLKRVADTQAKRVRDRIRQGRLKGLPSYRPTTIQLRKRLGHSTPLYRTGKLARSIRGFVFGSQATYCSSHPKAALLNDGGVENGKKIPAFNYLDATTQDLKTMAEDLADYVVDGR